MVLRPASDYGDCRLDGDYADCVLQNGGGHHFYESIKNGLEGFRLQTGDDLTASGATVDLLNDDNDTISSIASKKRIDSMFNKSADGGRRVQSIVDGGFDYGYGGGDDTVGKNTVQEKIEKMFAEVSSSELDTDVSMDSAAVAAGNTYHVQYIGCAGLSAKISSLEGLQDPVRDMYFGYRKNYGHGQNDFSGVLEISTAGLTIRYKNANGDGVNRTNEFPSIAVWAALKFVCRRRQNHNGYEYAFLPLISDPEGSDKAPLFRDVDPDDRARVDAPGEHAPIFAVVMRKTGKRLECHGFVCESENDALLMAANLYGALVAAMSTATESVPAPRRIKQRNGFTSMSSTAGSSVNGGCNITSPALPPPRPPRRNKKSTASSSDGATAPLSEVCSETRTFRMSVQQPASLKRGVCNSYADGSAQKSPVIRRVPSEQPDNGVGGGGDILTKVAIPRSRSFLKTNALGSKYSRRTAGCGGIEPATERRRRSNGSIMGFSDMFNELRVQEGLNNMDDILNAIINVEGMSFNDLKPIYREFLMKLALTLTKDELYQRTKVIMLEQKRRRSKTGRELNKRLRNAFNYSRAKSKISAALLPNFCKRKRFRKGHQKRRCSCSLGSASKIATTTTTTSVSAATISPVIARKSEQRKNKRVLKRTSAMKCQRLSSTNSTSDDSDFVAVAVQRPKTRKGGRVPSDGCLHQASSGYFSCSECSLTTNTCRCNSLGKCYCSEQPPSWISCSCDSDSCADSDKCYCGRRPNIFEELKSRGFAASESSLSVRADSPGTAWKKNEQLLVQQGPAKCGIEASKSLEYLQMKTNDPLQQYSKVIKGPDRMKVYNIHPALDSRSSGSSVAVYSSSRSGSSIQGRRTAGSSNSDNLQTIDYALFAGRKKPQPALSATSVRAAWAQGGYVKHKRGPPAFPARSSVPAAAMMARPSEYYPGAGLEPIKRMNRSHSSEMVHTNCQVYLSKRRHSIHDNDLSAAFRTDLENSLGYYP